MAEMATLQVRVISDGAVIERKFFGDSQLEVALDLYSSTITRWGDDPNNQGVAVQLIDGDDVEYETHFA